MLEKLGLTGWDILIHFSAIVLLIGGLFALLFRPVKKIITQRKELLAKTLADGEKLSAESAAAKAEYEQSITESRAQLARISEETAGKAKAKSAEIIKAAEDRAKEIIAAAKAEMESEKVRLTNEYRANVSELSVEIAGKILEKNITTEENQNIIDECLERWAE